MKFSDRPQAKVKPPTPARFALGPAGAQTQCSPLDYTILHHPKANVTLILPYPGVFYWWPVELVGCLWDQLTSDAQKPAYHTAQTVKIRQTVRKTDWKWTVVSRHIHCCASLQKSLSYLTCLIFSTCSWISLTETTGGWARTLVWIWVGLTADLYTNIKQSLFSPKQM